MKNGQLQRILLMMFLVFTILPVYSQEKNSTITAIEIHGLKRTNPQTARYPLEKFLGQEGTALDINEVQAAILDMRILEPVSVELFETEGGFVLDITVREKWSIFPIPMVMAGSGGVNFGLFFIDSNAFGRRDMMGLGGMYGSSNWMAMAMYQHTPDRSGLPGWNTSFMFSNREREDQDKNEDIHRRYTADQLRFSLGLSYPFTSYFSVNNSISFTNISLKENADAFNHPEEGAMLLGVNPGISLRNSSWDGFLLSERSLSLGYGYNYALLGSSYHQVDFRGTYEQSLIPGFRFTVRSGAVWKSESTAFAEDGPQKAQVDILPRNYSARNYAGLSAGLEKYIYNNRWGTLSVLGSWQSVFSYGSISGLEFNHGPMAGIRFYLSRLTIPAIGLGASYNMNSGVFQFAFSFGMGF